MAARGRVRFEPLGLEIEVSDAASVLTAARRVGAPLGAACDGDGICGACAVEVLEGAVPLVSELERRTCAANAVPAGLRLACLLPARGRLVVTAPYWRRGGD